MTRLQLAALFLLVTHIALLSLFYVLYVAGAGFPDGHRTDYDKAAQLLFIAMTVPALVLIGHAGYVAIKSAPPVRMAVKGLIRNAWSTLLVLTLLYGGNALLYSQLPHGQGG